MKRSYKLILNMAEMDQRILDFIRKHHVLTIATSVSDLPYCANCFYIYIPEHNIFVFTSDNETRHAGEFLINKKVAGSVVLETRIIGKIQGIQFTGIVSEPDKTLYEICKRQYLKRFPVAVIMKTNFWMVRPDFIKMTHNQLGFGKKLIWKEDSGIKEE